MHQLWPKPIAEGVYRQLSKRQREVLALLTHGLTNKQIAQELSISLDGAKWHVSAVLAALGMESRVEASRWYREQAAKAA